MRYIKTYESGFNFFKKKNKEEKEPVKVNKTKDEIEAEFENILTNKFIIGFRSMTNEIKLYHHYLDSHGANDIISYEFDIKSNTVDIIEPKTNVKLRIYYNKDTSDGIIIDNINVTIRSEIKWNSNEPHQEVNISRSVKFMIKKSWESFYAITEGREVSFYKRNLDESSYSFWLAVDDTITKHFRLIDHYVGLDEHNLRINKKMEEVKDELDHIKQCLGDIEDLSKQTTIKLANNEIQDGKIISKAAVIACSFEVESLTVSQVSGGVNINFDQKTIQLFDYITEAKNRIGDIFDENIKFDMDITNGKIILFINIPL